MFPRGQGFGGKSNNAPFSTGFNAGPAFGSMTATQGPRPNINFGGGLNHPAGHTVSGGLSHTSGLGNQGSLGATVPVLNTPNHQASVTAQHANNFNKKMHRLGYETNSAGINYQHSSGGNAFLSGSKTPGFPSTGTVGGAVPVGNDATVSGQTTFGHGRKPVHEANFRFKKHL